LVACSGAATEQDGVCAVEAYLSAEQATLGLSPPRVCADLVDLGDTTLVAAGVVPANVDFGAILSSSAIAHREELEGTRRLFSYDGITLSVPTASTGDLELAVLTAQAWATWKSSAPGSFGVIADMAKAPQGSTLPCCAWRNRLDHIVVSLDATPLEIGASVSLVGEPTPQGSEQVYGNTGLISIHRQTTLGGDPSRGSRPIYEAADDRENQLRYFADGAVFTLAHEASHLYIDQRNSVSEVANRIWDGRNFANASYVSAEEVVANFTACTALAGGMSTEMAAFNQEVTVRLRGYEGVEDRLVDLRGYALAGSERLVLAAGSDCGG
jgi:hypothetical protein